MSGAISSFVLLVPAPRISQPIRVVDKDTGAVVDFDLEEYLRHVIPAEAGVNWKMDALLAISVAARSYAMYAMERPRHLELGAHVCTGAHCQAFAPTNKRTDLAVEMTAGKVLTYKDEIIDAVYSLRCGGHTLSNEDGFGGEPLPYLRGVECICKGKKRGHGVGLCLEGTRAMAERGYSYVQILFYYYSIRTNDDEKRVSLRQLRRGFA